jgi:hypothetical protein
MYQASPGLLPGVAGRGFRDGASLPIDDLGA